MKIKQGLYRVASMRLLCLPCIFKKIFDILFKGFSICVCSVHHSAINKRCGYKWHVLIIAFAILQPCLVEASLKETRQVSSKFMNGNFKAWEFFSQDWANISRMIWPIARGGIKTFKFSAYNISEFPRSVKVGTDSVPTKAKETADKTCQAMKYHPGRWIK